MKQIYRLQPICPDFINALSISDEPPMLVDLMESKINYNNPNPVEVDKLPEAFKGYLFDFDYPLDNKYKNDFEITFLEHYMFRRIGYETYTSFKLHLKVKLKDIMPKYNKMFEGFSKLDFLGMKETHIRNETNARKETESGSSSGSTTNDNRYSQLPQNEIEDVQDGSYLTDYTYNTGTSSNTANRETNEGITTNEGIEITRADELEEYKKFLDFVNNIYSDIFRECDSLFFSVV